MLSHLFTTDDWRRYWDEYRAWQPRRGRRAVSPAYLPVDPRPASLAADLLFREGPEEDRAELRNAGAGGREEWVRRSRRAVEEARDGR